MKQEQLAALAMEFPANAYEVDDSRGFKLTGIGGYWIIERLNEVFGPCGEGWLYTVGVPDIRENEVVLCVTLRFRSGDNWSEPITAYGSSGIVKPNRVGDAIKAAMTDGLKKAASMLGIATDIYKGIGPPAASGKSTTKTARPPAPKPSDFVADKALFEASGATVFPGGKHEAEPVSSVYEADKQYLEWFVGKDAPAHEGWHQAWDAASYYLQYKALAA